MEKSSPYTNDVAGLAAPPETNLHRWRFQSNDSSSEADSRFWKNSNDTSVTTTITYAEHWAQTMQRNRRKGRPLEILWRAARNGAEISLVDESGFLPITPRMQLMAVRLLRRYWVHGEELHEAVSNSRDSKDDSSQTTPDGPGEIFY